MLVLSDVFGSEVTAESSVLSPQSCVYVRAALAESGGFNEQMTGIEVSPEFDLDVPYYGRLVWSACQQLCLDTPGCRSASYMASEQVCRLKSATCVEAQLGKGCTVLGSRFEAFLHIDRSTTLDFVAASWLTAMAYAGLTSQPGSFDAAVTTCQALDTQLTSLHSPGNLNTLVRMATNASLQLMPSLSGDSGPWHFWLNGRHSRDTGNITWADGTRFILHQSISVVAPGGCFALTIYNSTSRSLTVQPCNATGYPVCSAFPKGVEAWRFQTESTVVQVYDNRLSSQDTAAFCTSKGMRLFRPLGVRGRELIRDVAFQTPSITNAWVDGWCADGSQECYYANSSRISAEMMSPDLARTYSGPGCTVLGLPKSLPAFYYGAACDTLLAILCESVPPVPPVPGVKDVPARLRLLNSKAYAFVTAPRTYNEAESQCATMGGHLVSITDANTDALVSSTWFDMDGPSNNFVIFKYTRRILTYLGGDSYSGNGLAWLDGSPYVYEGEKLSASSMNNEGCLMMSSLGAGAPAPRWEVIPKTDCTTIRFNYTCKLPAKSYVQPSAAVASDGALFELHLHTPRTFPDAQEACQARGGNLAFLTPDTAFEDINFFVRRLRHEQIGIIPIMGDSFAYFIGAVTNKTDGQLRSADFTWVDSTAGPFNWPIWNAGFPPGAPVGYSFAAGTRTAAAFMSNNGATVVARKRYDNALPFLCRTPLGNPIGTASAPDGTVYEVLRTPYALPYHAAEQVCQERGGHLAGVSSPQQLGAVAQLCSAALQALPRTASGGFESHDVSDGCWVGLYCPAGHHGDVSFKDGFGERALHKLASFQPSILQGSSCSSASDLVWLDNRSSVGDGGMASLISGAASGLSLSSRCGVVRPGASSNSSTATLAMSPCKQFAAFVCERGGMSTPPALPSISVKQAAAPAASADPIPSGAVRYQGCYTLVDGQQQRAAASSLALAATPLPVLLSQNVSSLAQCYSLTRQAGLAFYSIVGGSACWGGATVPGLPFVNISDDSACRQSCSGDAGQQQPGCAAAGYTAVFALTGAATTAGTAVPASVIYTCMSEELVAAPNATVVGQLHISPSQLARCEALCSALAACDLYTYDTRAGACVLLGVPGVASLASLPVYDAQWARATCVKVVRLVADSALRELPSSSAIAVVPGRPTHLCSSALGYQLQSAGSAALTPRHGLPVVDAAACAASCAANATCQGFVVAPMSSDANASLLCTTRTGFVVDQSYEWLSARAWVDLPPVNSSIAGSSSGTAGEGCLVLSRLVPPPPYMCTDYVDAGGWELKQLNISDEQACRRACEANDECSLYVVYSSPASCSLRFRAFYNNTGAWPAVKGSNLRPDSSKLGTVRSCINTYRLLQPFVSPAMGRASRQVRLGADGAFHLCVPHMDLRGVDEFSADTFDDAKCAAECAAQSTCNYFITTYDAFETGVCYTKREPYIFTLGEDMEFPETGGMTRVDMVSVADSCLNLERQLPRSPPAYVCAQQYSAAFGAGARSIMSVATAYACEVLCNSDSGCVGYTWMAHNSTCVLATSSGSSSSGGNSTKVVAARSTGPAWLATQTCLQAPRLISSTGNGTAGQYVQASSTWHYCQPGGSVLSIAAQSQLDVLGVRALPSAGLSNASFASVRNCTRECAAVDGCQAFGLTWRNGTDVSPVCVLLGWSSAAAYAPVQGPAGSTAQVTLTCLVLASERTFPATAGGLAHPRVRPAAVQAYRNKQYSVYLQPASYSLAAATCQSAGAGGGQLLSVNSAQELTVVQALLGPHLQARTHPAAGVAQLDTTPFWTGLVWDGTINGSSNPSNGGCSGWCYSHGRTTDTSFVSSVLQAGSAAAGCGALDLIGGAPGLRAANCTAWLLPFVCEQQMPAVFVDGITSSAQPLQVFPAQAGYSQALQLASAAGAVLAVVDLTGATASSGRRHARALLQGSAAVRFGSVSAAASACGLPQLRSSGCWVQLQAPADACNSNSSSSGSTAALCGATALLLTDAASSAASTLNSLAGLDAGSSTCAAALVDSSGSSSYVRAPCSTQAAYLAAVVDPDAPLRAALPPPADSSSDNSLSGGAIAGIVVGSVVGGLLVIGLALFAWVRWRGAQRAGAGGDTAVKAGSKVDQQADNGFDHSTHAGDKDKEKDGQHTDRSAPYAVSITGDSLGNGDAARLRSSSDGPLPPGPVSMGSSNAQAAPSPAPASPKVVAAQQPFGDGRPVALGNSTEGYSNSDVTTATTVVGGGAGGPNSSRSHYTYTNSIMSLQDRSREAAPGSPRLLRQLVVTAEDPDHLDVTWQIDPNKDVSWDENDELGKGTFGVVYRGLYKGEPVAIKTVMRGGHGKYEMDALKSLLQEARILAKVRHPNVVTCYGGCITDKNVFIVEELMQQNLGELIHSTGEALLPLDTVLRIAMDVASGLFQLHPTIVHRDLKPDNVLLDAAGRAKISDFGLARFKLQSYLASTKNFAAGTIPFMPPEALGEEINKISEKADIYSLAVVIWTMLTGKVQPWQNYHYAAVLYKVSMRGERPQLPEDPNRCPPRLAGLITRMWSQDPAARPGAGEVLKQLGVILRDVERVMGTGATQSHRHSATLDSPCSQSTRDVAHSSGQRDGDNSGKRSSRALSHAPADAVGSR
ncbi:hypothetical protein HYH02_005867 [Chlamydomonas schloesseri]|uniref:C-type lectin domain-containing protein n=1 Tax=Chlamydomonas schloesseri TaxID=2026947 RepID=A0A835WKV3_9CHLO|nr:hypothetical protein HYH02_005867 [Chlamydomonas schloesseri]|eukprot:KAG2449119.1 hypothetical protein HYH02_005867 [Chlamydomonas schloesseri]